MLKRKMRVVLVDDNDDIRETLERKLKRHGYEVYSFANPTVCPLQISPKCRCRIGEYCTDVILTDIHMPFMDGIEFLKNNRKKHCKAKDKIVMSSELTDENRELLDVLGFMGFQKTAAYEDLFNYLEGVEKEINPRIRLQDWFLDKE